MNNSPAVAINTLCFSWQPQQTPILDIPSLAINRGEKVFIQGGSGSGKSTLLSLLAGIQVPQKGAVTVLGQDLQQLSPAQRDRFRAEHIGYVFQQFNLLPFLSVVENITLAVSFCKGRKQRVLKSHGSLQQGVEVLLQRLGIASELWQKAAGELSVGQQQRVAIARALMGEPEIIIADEPTSALDADARDSFMQLLFEQADSIGATLIFVSHDMSLKSRFDTLIPISELRGQPCS